MNFFQVDVVDGDTFFDLFLEELHRIVLCGNTSNTLITHGQVSVQQQQNNVRHNRTIKQNSQKRPSTFRAVRSE